MKTVLVSLFAFAFTNLAQAQTPPVSQHLPRGTAVDITSAEILLPHCIGSGERSANSSG